METRVALTQFPRLLISYINMIHLLLRKYWCIIYYQLKSILYSDLYRFFPLQDPGQEIILTFSCNVSLGSS